MPEPSTESSFPVEEMHERRAKFSGRTIMACSRCGQELGVPDRAKPHTLRDCFDRMASDLQDLMWWRDSVQEAVR